MGLFSMKLFHKSGSKADKSAESVSENYNVIAEQLTDAWSDRGYALAAFDIYSDSYVVFVCRREILPTLSAAADKTGHRIALAQEM